MVKVKFEIISVITYLLTRLGGVHQSKMNQIETDLSQCQIATIIKIEDQTDFIRSNFSPTQILYQSCLGGSTIKF